MQFCINDSCTVCRERQSESERCQCVHDSKKEIDFWCVEQANRRPKRSSEQKVHNKWIRAAPFSTPQKRLAQRDCAPLQVLRCIRCSWQWLYYYFAVICMRHMCASRDLYALEHGQCTAISIRQWKSNEMLTNGSWALNARPTTFDHRRRRHRAL